MLTPEKLPVLTELAPIAVPSIAPPLISTVANVAVLEEFIVVKAPVEAVLAPIVVLSIAPPSQSIVPFTSNVPPTVRVLPEPTLRPTDVPLPAEVKIPSTASKLVFNFPPQVDVDPPVSYTHLTLPTKRIV